MISAIGRFFNLVFAIVGSFEDRGWRIEDRGSRHRFDPKSFIINPTSSILYPLSSILYPLSSILYPRPSFAIGRPPPQSPYSQLRDRLDRNGESVSGRHRVRRQAGCP